MGAGFVGNVGVEVTLPLGVVPMGPLVLVLVLVVGGGKQAGHVTDALSHALSEEQLGSQAQVLRVLDEAEPDHRPLPRAQLLLVEERGTRKR